MERTRIPMEDFMIGWVSALPIELAAAIGAMDEKYSEPQVSQLPQGVEKTKLYTFGRIGPHKVVVACLPESLTGTGSAAAVASEMRRLFPRIRFWFLVGTGGGVPLGDSDLRLGDVVISDASMEHGGAVQYDLGKTDSIGRYEQTGSLNAPPAVLLKLLSSVRSNHFQDRGKSLKYLNSVYGSLFLRPAWLDFGSARLRDSDILFESSYGHIGGFMCNQCSTKEKIERTRCPTSVHFGRIASVNQVINDGVARDSLSWEFGGVLCFETEAFGLMNDFPCIIIRGICDYSDSHKYSRWQPYAAATAAACVKELLSLIPPAEVAKTALPSSKAAATTNDQVLPRGKLKEFKLPDVPTILILGETSVGKATFINAFVNYLQFETLDESLCVKNLHWAVPHSFTLQYIDASSLSGQFVFKEIRIHPTTN
jgi:nucleoside phosphorylase